MLGPIFIREWLTVPRRSRHYVVRAAYLGVMWILGITAWQVIVGWNRTATLGDTAHFGSVFFSILTLYVQLPLLLFFSALSAASAVAREKDRRTFVLLLMTDLRNYEIVLGKLLGSLLQIVLLVAAVVPLLMMLVWLGGISPSQVGQSVIIMAAAAAAAGSLGTLIALWREKTFPALALTVLSLVLYLSLVRAAGLLPIFHPGSGSGEAGMLASLPNWLDPFLAMQSVLDPASTAGELIQPAIGFGMMMLILTVVLNLWGIARLRVWNPSGEPIMQRETPETAGAESAIGLPLTRRRALRVKFGPIRLSGAKSARAPTGRGHSWSKLLIFWSWV